MAKSKIPDWEKAGMAQIYIEVEISKESLQLVLGTFNYMKDTPGIIDYNMQDVSSPQDLDEIIRKLSNQLEANSQETLKIPLQYGEWVDLTSFLRKGSQLEPDSKRADFLERLYSSLSEWEDAQFKPKFEAPKP